MSRVIGLPIHGWLTMVTVAEHELAVLGALEEDGADVVLDLTRAIHVTSSGLSMVRLLRSVLSSHGRRLIVVAPDALVEPLSHGDVPPCAIVAPSS